MARGTKGAKTMEFLEALADTANSLARFAIIIIMVAIVYLALTSIFGG